ncbi:MAG: potassium-transporting ATPase subunit KdpA [Sandaracinaceae bacterium]|nr:potassium-transporting ATPase subunit KdpA [Sandaracinaceae bacterium]
MTLNSTLQLALYVVVLTGLGIPLGRYMARVYEGNAKIADKILGPVERLLYRLAGVDPKAEQSWKQYAFGVLLFSGLGMLVVYALQRAQAGLPLNPDELGAVSPEVSFNTAASFASNTNWQAYGGETTMSYLTQMLALTVQNFVSAATGMAVLVALIRGITRKQTDQIGNFWVDLTRSTLHILLPLSIVLALILVSQGVVQTFEAHAVARLLDATTDGDGAAVIDQILARGPAASQIAIKQLGTNGGGFFNVNSAHPFENPTALSNFFELLAILLIPAALCFTFGEMVKDRRQGWAIYAAMTILFVACLIPTLMLEQAGTPALRDAGADLAPSALQAGGNMEGKEARYGIAQSALWAVATTSASNGSVSSMHDSYTPLGGMFPIWLMQLGEVVYGGVGSGLYGMLLFVIVAVFIAGLMVGRTPEYLGKKIEAYEMKMASIGILIPTALILVTTAIACVTDAGRATVYNPGAHGYSEILYAMTSTGANNGSAFGGITVNTPFYATIHGINMLISRFWIIVAVLAIAGALAKKKLVPAGPGTLPTHTPLFVGLLVGTVVLVGALSFIPALALGPIVEHLQMLGH